MAAATPLLVPALVLFLALAGRAQAPPAVHVDPPASPSRISIDVEVTEKSGQPIYGLSAADFTLLDNNQPAKLLDFAAVDARGQTAGLTQVLVIVDTINASIVTVSREREELGQFLRQSGGELAHPTSIAFLAESGIKVDQQPTQDGNALFALLKDSKVGLRQEGRSTGFYGAADRLKWSLNQLSQIVAFEAKQPGRKLLLFISPGWPMLTQAGVQEDTKQRTWVLNAIMQLSDELREARVALYCLNPFDMGRNNPYFYQDYLKPVTKLNQAEFPALSLQVFAEHTGGLVFATGGNDLKAEIDTATRDAGGYYTLVFAAAPPGEKTEYHALRVKVDRPGAAARTTAGYYVQAHP
jgi:VWFA-related protein